MRRLSKTILCAALLVGGVGPGLAFSLLGPFKTWQVGGLGYQLPGDIGGPMTLSEGYRFNVPTATYAYDESFIKYFGKQGMAAVDQAIKIVNDLPAASAITNDASSLYIRGHRVPTDVTGQNLEAEAAQLLDLKSHALRLVVEELGLAEPERFVWTLRGRNTETVGGVTFTNYSVIKLNYDPITLQPSSYVNGHLYTYRVVEPLLPGNYADAIESARDPFDPYTFSSVAGSVPFWGQFFIGLSQDDVGGLRFLYNRNNIATENLVTGVTPAIPPTGGRSSPWFPFVGVVTPAMVPSPWLPFFGGTNGFLQGTNIVQGTNTFFNSIAFSNLLSNTNLTNLLITTGLRPGVNKLRFQKVAYDSLIGQTFAPITNKYTDNVITNRTLVLQPVARAINQPDLLFVVQDLGLFNNLTPVLTRRTDTTGWQNNDAINGRGAAGGPGVITSTGTNATIQISFTDQLPFFLNQTPNFLTEDSSTGFGLGVGTLANSGVWGSFDGTTNTPVIYPAYGNLTLQDIINQVLQAGSGN